MRRSVMFCLWRAQWWRQRASGVDGKPSHVIEGLRGYASEQGDAEERRAVLWAAKWRAVRERSKIVLSTHLSSADSSTILPDLVVELEAEEEEEEGDEEEADKD